MDTPEKVEKHISIIKNGSMYEIVKKVLTEDETTRLDDKKLIWRVYGSMGFVVNGVLDYGSFKNCPTPETVTRARRKVQELHPELTDKYTKRNRAKREMKKGFFVYNERYE
jgi:hypothetical protein